MSVKYFDKTQNKWVIFPGSIGAPGRSAYELAVQQGYKGTLDEWLLSLKGKDAYTIAVEGGYKGTEKEFNNALTTAPIAVDKINNADLVPTKDSVNLVLSGGVKDAIDSLNTSIDADLETINNSITTINNNITNIVNTEISNQIKSSIVDNLTSSETEKSLSAKQGKVLKDLIDSLANLQITIVNSLPSVGESNIIYLVKKSGTGTDVHDEYIYVEGAWEKIGTTDIDLSDYYTKSQVDTITNGLDNKISNNTLRINNITTNGSITPEVLKIQKNGVDLLDPWNGSKEGVANIVVPTSLSELNPTEQDIIDALGYRPADAAQAGMGDITGPSSSIDSNIVLFSGTNGKTIKDSNYNVGSFAVKNHTHTVSQITDFPEIPEAITVDSALSTTSENPVQNKVITTQLNNKVNNATLSSYVKTVDLNTTLGNYYTTTEVYTKKQVDDKIPSLNGYATESWVTNQGYSTENTWRPVKVGSTTLSDSSTTLTIANGTGIGLTLANGTLTITNSAPGSSYTLPVAKDNILGGIKTGYTESGGAEMAIYTLEDGTAYTLLRDTAVKTALGFTPANVNDIPIALPNPYALNITAGGSSTNYTGSATANLNLDKVFSKKLATVTTPGQPGIFVGTAASYEVSSLYVSENNPDAIIVIPASSSISFNNTIYTEMKDLGSLTGGTYKCYCITYINSSIVLVNGAVYGYDATN